MVATRRGAKSALADATAPTNALDAPPKRGGKRKAVVEEAAVPAVTPLTRTITTKRKAKAAPEADAPPMAKKTTVTAKAARAAQAETKAEPALAAPKRATRGRKPEAAVAVEEQEPAVVERVIKPATTRARRGPAKTAAVVEEAPKPASRKAPAKKAAATKKAKGPVVEEPVVEATEPVKPAPRARKAAAPKAAEPTPILAPRATRGHHVASLTQDSPLKAPARKPRKKAAAAPTPVPATVIAAMVEPEPIEEPFAEFPGIPTTPAHFGQNFTAKRALRELPQYPHTPAHIQAPVSTNAALAELPGYPQTPAHIKAPISSKAALAEMPSYPNTPAHVKAPSPDAQVIAEIAEEPETPVQAHVTVEAMDVNEDAMEIDDGDVVQASNEDAMGELPDYPTTPAHIVAPINTKDALKALPDYPMTPAHIKAPLANKEALNELPDYPKTPALTHAPPVSMESPVQLPGVSQTPTKSASSPAAASVHDLASTESTTPTRITSPVQDVAIEASTTPKSVVSTPKAGSVTASPVLESSTPNQLSSPITEGNFLSGTPRMPENITWGVTDQEAFEELPAGYPTTPAHINAPVSTQAALAELPGYPKTPAHISAPLTPRRALAELPSYPTTPAIAMEAALQAEISASAKKQTPSPLAKKQSPLVFPGLEDVSLSFAHDDSEVTDVTDMDSEVHEEATQKLALAPLQLTAPPQLAAPTQLSTTLSAPEPASPIKSALRSPQKTETKTPKKAVTWDDPEESGISLLYGGPLQGMTFLVDVTRKGRDQEFLFRILLEQLGAKVVQEWESTPISHVLYKDGSENTLQKVIASKGAIKCLNVGFLLDCEREQKRVDENPYLVDLSIAMPASPKPITNFRMYTPMRTPARYKVAPPSACRSLPTTPTSSELDRSMNFDDKENSELGMFFHPDFYQEARTLPQKKSSFLFGRSPIKTPSQPKFLAQTPVKPKFAIKPATTAGKKRPVEESFPSIIAAPPKKLRLF